MSNQAQVCVSVLNLHAQPDIRSEVVSQALYGWKVLILEQDQNFYLIQTHDYQGWIEAKDVRGYSPSSELSKKIKIIYNAVPVYPNPHVKSKPLWIFPFEVELAVLTEPLDEERRWIQVELIEGAGWIQRGHVGLEASALSLTQMLEMSRQFLGVPYIWGGVSSFGYDCSGFIQMLWRQRGIRLPRDAWQQFQQKNCCPVEWENLVPGDLLFYGSSEADIRHVGLYLGHQTLIHASVKPIPIVQESYLDDPSLCQRFVYRTARRLSFNHKDLLDHYKGEIL